MTDNQQLEASDLPAAPSEPTLADTGRMSGAPAEPAGGEHRARCPGRRPDGRACRAAPGPSGHCLFHDPARAEQVALARVRGADTTNGRHQVDLKSFGISGLPSSLDMGKPSHLPVILAATTRALAEGKISNGTAQAIASLVNAAGRLIEAELEADAKRLQQAWLVLEEERDRRS